MDPAPRRLPRFRRVVTAADAGANAPVVVGAFLLPATELAGGWQLRRRADAPGQAPAEFASLAEAARALDLEEEFALGLPLDLGLVARFVLPEAPPDELEGMLRIQLEKILPYAEDDLRLDHAVVERRPGVAEGEAGELVVAAYPVHRERLLALCRPLVEAERWPRQVTYAALLRAVSAAGEGADGPTLLAYREGGETVVAVCERARLVFAQPLPGSTRPETLGEDLPPVLLGAELEGVPTGFTRLALAEDLPESWRDGFQRVLDADGSAPRAVPAPVLPRPGGESALGDLSPSVWRVARGRRARAARLRGRLLLAGAIYLGLLVLGFADLARLRYVRRKLDKRIDAAAAPLAEADAARKRWQTLAPATDFRQSVVEILDQVRQCLPPGNTDLRITLLDLNRSRSPGILTLEGEAPSYEAAIELGEKLRNRAELRDFRPAPEQPAILPNGRAHFRVTGRLP